MPIAETARLSLHRITRSDAAFICRLLNEPSWLQNIGDRGVRDAAQAEQYIDSKIVQAYESLGFGMYRVHSKHAGVPIGICGLVQRQNLPAPDIGFAFLPEFWGQGYAREAAAAVIDDSRQRLGLSKLLGIVTPRNERSCRLLEALGFVHEGSFRSEPTLEELKLYALALQP